MDRSQRTAMRLGVAEASLQNEIRRNVRRSILEYKQRAKAKEVRAHREADELMGITALEVNTEESVLACKGVATLLNELTVHTDIDEYAMAQQHLEANAPQQQQATEDPFLSAAALLDQKLKDDVAGDVHGRREVAAEDLSFDTSSVHNYAQEPAPGPAFSATCIADVLNDIVESSKRMNESSMELARILADNTQWWNSPVVVKDLRSHAVRANYHARKVRAYSELGRSHTHVYANYITQITSLATREVHEQKMKLSEAHKAQREQDSTMHAMKDEIAALTKELDEGKKMLHAYTRKIASTVTNEFGSEFNSLDAETLEDVFLLMKLRRHKSLLSNVETAIENLLHPL